MLSVKPWRGEAVLQFCATLLVCLCLGVAITGLLAHAGVSAFQPPVGYGAVLLGTLSFQGVAWLLIGFFLHQHQVDWWEAFGLRGPHLKRALLLAVVTALLVLPLAWGLQVCSVDALRRLGRPPQEQAAVTLLMDARLDWLRVYLAVFTVGIAPVAEEFIFRGMLYPFIKQLGWPKLAWFGVSFLFALIHNDTATFLPLFVLALVLIWLYEHTDNLLAPITVHALFNAVNLVMLYFQTPLSRLLHVLFRAVHPQ